VVLIVPMCLLASVAGLLFRGMSIDILAQIGFVVLVGLAAKNAILIVEFARQAQDAGSKPTDAAVSAARRRLRPMRFVARLPETFADSHLPKTLEPAL
jgi:multidrug efflux pump subunit AcrB